MSGWPAGFGNIPSPGVAVSLSLVSHCRQVKLQLLPPGPHPGMELSLPPGPRVEVVEGGVARLGGLGGERVELRPGPGDTPLNITICYQVCLHHYRTTLLKYWS